MNDHQNITGIYPGTFDPVTFGHLDIVERACNIVDKLIQNHKIAWICGAFVAAMNNYLCSKYLLFDD